MSKQYVSAANARQAASAHSAIHPATRAAPPPISAPGSSEPAAVLIIGSLEEGVDTIVGPFPSSEAAPMWCATPPGERGRPGQRPVQVGDRCFAWVAEGIVRFLSDEAVERDYQIIEDSVAVQLDGRSAAAAPSSTPSMPEPRIRCRWAM